MIVHTFLVASLVIVVSADSIITSLINAKLRKFGIVQQKVPQDWKLGKIVTECKGRQLIEERRGMGGSKEVWKVGRVVTGCEGKGPIEQQLWRDNGETRRIEKERIGIGREEGKSIENRGWERLRVEKGRIREERIGIGREEKRRWEDIVKDRIGGEEIGRIEERRRAGLDLEKGRIEEERLEGRRWENIEKGRRLEKGRLEEGKRWEESQEGLSLEKGRIGVVIEKDLRLEKGRIGEERIKVGLEKGKIEEGRREEERRWKLGEGRIEEIGRRWGEEEGLKLEGEGLRLEKGDIEEGRREEERRWKLGEGRIEETGWRWGEEEGLKLERGRIGVEGEGLRLEKGKIEEGRRKEERRWKVGEGRIEEAGWRWGEEEGLKLERGRIGLEGKGLRLEKGKIEEGRREEERRWKVGEGRIEGGGKRWGEEEGLKFERGRIEEERMDGGHRGIEEIGKERYLDVYARPKYEFSYGVRDPKTGDRKDQSEIRVDNVVKGEYSLAEPDGTIRVVRYEVDDKNGFNAQVDRIGKSLHPEVYGWRPLGREIENPSKRL